MKSSSACCPRSCARAIVRCCTSPIRVARIVKAADKLSAYIKCVGELKAGNREFESAARQTREALVGMHLPCLDYFMAHFLDAFQLTLDELE